MLIYRIADRRHPAWDGAGAMLLGGRWNSPGRPVIYGALSFAGAMLEILAHARIGRIPKSHVSVIADVSEAVSREWVELNQLPVDWDHPNAILSREMGDRWLDERRSAILLVPSVVARGDFNALVNPSHPDAENIRVLPPAPVIWDARLFPFG